MKGQQMINQAPIPFLRTLRRQPAQLLLVACALLAADLARAESDTTRPVPFVVTACVRTETPPVIDGKLDDVCWRNTRPVKPFVKLTAGTPVKEQTTGYLVYDSENLYIGVHCEESQMERIKAEVTKRDGPVWQDDCIEIFLIPPQSAVLARFAERVRYFHLIVNTLGVRYDEIGVSFRQTFDGQWQAAVSKGPASWDLEVAVAFAELGTSAKDGDVWIGNISRARWLTGEYSTWAPI